MLDKDRQIITINLECNCSYSFSVYFKSGLQYDNFEEHIIKYTYNNIIDNIVIESICDKHISTIKDHIIHILTEYYKQQ